MFGNYLRDGAIYDPSTQGAIDGIDFSWDVFVEHVAGGGIVLRQGGVFYYSLKQQLSSPFPMFWETVVGTGVGATGFLACEGLYGPICTGTGTGNPDFSNSGGPIEFGFFQAVSILGGSSTTSVTFTSRIDNWSVTVNSVPEPGSTALVLAGVLVSIRMGRRRHGHGARTQA